MNKQRRKELDELASQIKQISARVETLKLEETDEDASSLLESAEGALDEAAGYIEAAHDAGLSM